MRHQTSRFLYISALIVLLGLALGGAGCSSSKDEDTYTLDLEGFEQVHQFAVDMLPQVEGKETLVKLYRKDMEQVTTYEMEGGQVYVIVSTDLVKKETSKYVDDDNDGEFKKVPEKGQIDISGYAFKPTANATDAAASPDQSQAQ